MRRVLVGLSVVVLGSSACTNSDAAAKPSDGALILEVGGEHSSLRQALVSNGVVVAPAQMLRPEGAEPVSAAESPLREPQAENSPEPPPTQPPAPSPGEDFVVVKLGRGQTLIHLAKKHLGDGNRFREILALNGWTEADARRLPEGQDVKVPRAAGSGAASSRR